MIPIDGSYGEGGGQIIRTSLALSAITGKECYIENIRKKRKRSGLLRQHATAVKAAATICGADVPEELFGLEELHFKPTTIASGNYTFTIGSAGSTGLVLQTVLPILLYGKEKSTITIEGGTHNQKSPSYDFLGNSFFPCLRDMGITIESELEEYGFYPAGGGKVTFSITPIDTLQEVHYDKRKQRSGTFRSTVFLSNLPIEIATEQRKLLMAQLHLTNKECCIDNVPSRGPGNVATITLEDQGRYSVFTSFGERGKSSRLVVRSCREEAEHFYRSEASVNEYLADQLLVPMALAGGGSFYCNTPSEHTNTNIEIIKKFLPVEISLIEKGNDLYYCTIEKKDR